MLKQSQLKIDHAATLTVRSAHWRDKFAICPIEMASFGFERVLFGLWQRVGSKHTHTWLADLNGWHVGYTIAYPRPLHGVPTFYVGGVGVRRECRNLGIGKEMMHAVLAFSPKTWLHVRATNAAAIHMYKQLGFQHIQTENRFYSNKEDAFIMLKS